MRHTIVIIKIYSNVQSKVLLYGETALSEKSFSALRKLVMDEFGHGGAKDRLAEALGGDDK